MLILFYIAQVFQEYVTLLRSPCVSQKFNYTPEWEEYTDSCTTD